VNFLPNISSKALGQFPTKISLLYRFRTISDKNLAIVPGYIFCEFFAKYFSKALGHFLWIFCQICI